MSLEARFHFPLFLLLLPFRRPFHSPFFDGVFISIFGASFSTRRFGQMRDVKLKSCTSAYCVWCVEPKRLHVFLDYYFVSVDIYMFVWAIRFYGVKLE